MAFPKLQVQVTADTKQAEDGLKKVSGDIGQVEKASTRAVSAVKAFAVGLASIATVSAVFSRAVAESQKFETTMFRIGAVIKATGGVAGRTADDLRSFARELAMNTLESTEGVLEAQQRLLTFRKVTGDVFDRTIRVAADLSAVLGQNMSSSAIQLGRALEDPVTGLTALTRSGTVFTDQQKEMVKQLVESGQLLKAQSFILDELEAQYGGAAVAAAQGYAGALDTLGQRLQEFFLSIDENLGLTKALSSVYLTAAEALRVLTENMGRLVTYIGTAMAASVAYAAFMARGWVASFVAARLATITLAGSLALLRTAMIRTGILALIVGAGELVYQFTRLVGAAGGFGEAMGLLGDVAVEVWGRIKDGAAGLGAALKSTWLSVQAGFMDMIASIQMSWSDMLYNLGAGIANISGLEGLGNSLMAAGNNVLGAAVGSGGALATASELRGKASSEGERAAGLFAGLDAPLESVQKIRDLLASIKDERITLPDLLGVGTDEGDGGGGKKKTPLEEQTEAQIASLQALRDQGRETWSALGTFLQQFAGKSKAAAIAAIAIQKGLSIAQIISNTAAAQMRALAELGPIAGPPVAAKMGLYGKLQAGLVAATGLAQAMGSGGSAGGSAPSLGGGAGTTQPAQPPQPTQTVAINLQGDTFSRASVEGLLEQIQSQLDRGGRLVFQ
ncbi:MAG: phage tail length tape measure family protein [Verrucomicrobiales bacterium]|nr:phage tail length tape measure family protein [Verrucomicrobiales bacterium]